MSRLFITAHLLFFVTAPLVGQNTAPASTTGAAAVPAPVAAPSTPPQTPAPTAKLGLPTDNDAIFREDGPAFYMFVDRDFEQQKSTPWEGGQFGFVRGPVRLGGNVIQMHFHEGIDVAPVKRDATGEPLDEVRSVLPGEVVHASVSPGASNYGRYVVVRHDWGQGPFCSLYAHLSKVNVLPGQKVEPGSVLGIMGHTGAGIDRRRSHVHVEFNLILSSRFEEWHSKNFRPSPNAHGIWNGLNLTGINIAQLLLEQKKNPALTPAEFVKRTDPKWKVVVPRKGELEILRNYPWLGEGTEAPSPSWEITLASSGLPIAIQPNATTVAKPQITWVKDEGIPHVYYSRGYVSGTGNTGTLTGSGTRFIELLTGDFQAPPVTAAATPKVTTKAASKSKSTVKSKTKKK